MVADGLATQSQPVSGVLDIVAGTETFALTTLTKVAAGTAQALAMLAAAATETRIQPLPGFVGAAFPASDDDDMLLQFMQWHSAETLAAVCGDQRYSDYAAVIADHGTLRYSGSSPQLVLNESFSFARGDRIMVALTDLEAESADNLSAAIGPPQQEQMLHVAPAAHQRSVMTFSKTGGLPSMPGLFGEERWRSSFSVIEAVSRDPRASGRADKYRLLPLARASHAESLEAAHA